MGFCYDKLWKKLIDKKMNKYDLQCAINTTPKTIAKMGKDEYVSMATLDKICNFFECDISDIVEHKKEINIGVLEDD